jgi:hypothetical protein
LKSDGKGFTGILVPTGYNGGIGCLDVVPPVIELLGPNPKRFRVARASGIKGVISLHGDNNDGSNAKIEALIVEQRKMYENDIKVSFFVGPIVCVESLNASSQTLNKTRIRY